MDALLDSLPLAQSLQSKESSHGRRQESGAREYFSILCRLVDGLPTPEGGQKVIMASNLLAKPIENDIKKENTALSLIGYSMMFIRDQKLI